MRYSLCWLCTYGFACDMGNWIDKSDSVSRDWNAVVNVSQKTVVMEDKWHYPSTALIPLASTQKELYSKAQNLYDQQRWKESAEVLLQIIDTEPTHFSAHSLLASVFIQMGDISQAQEAAEYAVHLQPSALGYINLASVLLLQQNYAESERYYLLALQLQPHSFLAVRNLASIYYQTHRYDLAERYIRHLIRLAPRDAYGYIALGQILVDQGRLLEAKKMYLYRLQEVDFFSPSFLHTSSGYSLEIPMGLAEIAKQQGDYQEAKHWYLRTISDSWVYTHSVISAEQYAATALERLLLISIQAEYSVDTVTKETHQWFVEASVQLDPQKKQETQLWLQREIERMYHFVGQ